MQRRNIQGNVEICRKLPGKFLKPPKSLFINIIIQADDKTVLLKQWNVHGRGPAHFSTMKPADEDFRTGDLPTGRRYFGKPLVVKKSSTRKPVPVEQEKIIAKADKPAHDPTKHPMAGEKK